MTISRNCRVGQLRLISKGRAINHSHQLGIMCRTWVTGLVENGAGQQGNFTRVIVVCVPRVIEWLQREQIRRRFCSSQNRTMDFRASYIWPGGQIHSIGTNNVCVSAFSTNQFHPVLVHTWYELSKTGSTISQSKLVRAPLPPTANLSFHFPIRGFWVAIFCTNKTFVW